MMAFLLALFAIGEVIPPPQPYAAEDEIVVIGKKLALTQGEIKTNVLTGKAKCTVSKTSGDPRVDKAVCDIATACLRARKDGPAFKPCVQEGRLRFLEGLARANEGKAR